MFAVLHVEAFALQAALRTGPPVAGTRPAGLITGLGRQTGIGECNRAARAAGLSAGMSVAQALARCPARASASAAGSGARRSRAAFCNNAFRPRGDSPSSRFRA